MFDSLINLVSGAFNSIIEFLGNIVSSIVDFLKDMAVNFYDFIIDLLNLAWSAFQWVKNETMTVLYNVFKDFISGLNIPFPSSLNDNIIQWYHQINIFFPADSALDVALILLNTWLLVLTIKIGFKVKLMVGGLIAKPLFK
ncbi:MAG: hypothetical protein WCP55_04625 [Lentisphaerota bacterium]